MEKRILADYRWQDYRAQAAQLDELAQAGWQLQSEGVLGLIFTETEPAERHHRVIYVPKDEEFLPPADWMGGYRKRGPRYSHDLGRRAGSRPSDASAGAQGAHE